MPVEPSMREEVESWWRAVIAGEVTREVGHDWAETLMFDDYSDSSMPDPLAVSGLQYLHGFDMTWRSADRLVGHGPPGEYVKPLREIQCDLDRWRANCRQYDADPVGWTRRARTEARQAADREDG